MNIRILFIPVVVLPLFFLTVATSYSYTSAHFTDFNGMPADVATVQDDSDRDSDEEERFRAAMEHYGEAEYDSAAVLFDGIPTPEARLFSGKSYFALGNYPLAKQHLHQLTRDDDPRLFDESRYTLALAHIQTRQFGISLDMLHDLKSRPAYQNLNRDADEVYDRILGYLTTEQRRQALSQSVSVPVQLDLFRYGLDHMVRSEANELYNTLYPLYESTVDTNILAALNRRIQRLPRELSPSHSFGPPPNGMVHNIGVLLPVTEPGSGEWRISRSLYNGYLLAAEEFNREHEDRHIRLHHIETSDTSLTQEAALTKLAWTHHADAVIGPLFSDAAYRIGRLAEYYQIPVIPPLANADTLNISNPYLYQINPTFETRGRAMAAFAVNELGLDTLAVITQRNQPVSREGREFRNEAERLGATVLYYFSEDFEARAFEVDHITPYFAGDERFIESFIEDLLDDPEEEHFELQPVKGLYISVTGAGAEQLIELILNDLQATRSRVTILGNEEMAHVQLSNAARSYFDIYYSNFFHRDDDRRQTYNFQSNYRSLSGSNPDNFGHLGYDVGTFVFQSIARLQNPARLKQELRNRPLYEGVITNIDFRNSHINQHLHIFRVDRDETVRVKFGDFDEDSDNGNNDDP